MPRFFMQMLTRRLHAADNNDAGGGFDPSLVFAGADPDPDDETDFDSLDRGDTVDDDPGEHHIPMPDGRHPDEDPQQGQPPADPPKDETPPADPPKDETPPADPPKGEQQQDDDSQHDDGHRVPKYRLDSEVRKRREAERAKSELERRLEQLQGQQAPQQQPAPQQRDPHGQQHQPPQQQAPQQQPAQGQQPPQQESMLDRLNNEVADLDRQLNEAILDNELDKAAELRRQLRAKEFEAYRTEIETTSRQTTEQVTEQNRVQEELNAEAERLMQDYPMLDTEHEKYSPDMVDEIVMLRNAYMQRGDNPALALRRATTMVASDYGFTPASSTPPPANNQQPDNNAAAAAAAAQQQTQDRKADAARRQPPRSTGSSNAQQQQPHPYELPEDQFDQLTEEQLAAARGDFIA